MSELTDLSQDPTSSLEAYHAVTSSESHAANSEAASRGGAGGTQGTGALTTSGMPEADSEITYSETSVSHSASGTTKEIIDSQSITEEPSGKFIETNSKTTEEFTGGHPSTLGADSSPAQTELSSSESNEKVISAAQAHAIEASHAALDSSYETIEQVNTPIGSQVEHSMGMATDSTEMAPDQIQNDLTPAQAQQIAKDSLGTLDRSMQAQHDVTELDFSSQNQNDLTPAQAQQIAKDSLQVQHDAEEFRQDLSSVTDITDSLAQKDLSSENHAVLQADTQERNAHFNDASKRLQEIDHDLGRLETYSESGSASADWSSEREAAAREFSLGRDSSSSESHSLDRDQPSDRESSARTWNSAGSHESQEHEASEAHEHEAHEAAQQQEQAIQIM